MTEPNNNKELQDKPIFIAVLTKDKEFRIEIKSNNMMVLSYAYRLLGLQIDNMIIGAQQAKKPKIISQGGLESLRKFLGKK